MHHTPNAAYDVSEDDLKDAIDTVAYHERARALDEREAVVRAREEHADRWQTTLLVRESVIDQWQRTVQARSAPADESDVRRGEQDRALMDGLFHALETSEAVLLAHVEVKDGVARRLWSSSSYSTSLGHDASRCVGDERDMTHIYTQEFIESELPELVRLYEAGGLSSADAVVYTPLRDASGALVPFSHRVARDSACPETRFYLVSTDERRNESRLQDAREQGRRELETDRLWIDAEKAAVEATGRHAAAELQRVQQEVVRCLDCSFDLVTKICIRDGQARRVWNSSSHMVVLGHDPAALLGNDAENHALYDARWLRDVQPVLLKRFLAGELSDGAILEVPLMHANGRQKMMFEARLTIDPDDPDVFVVVHRDLSDRIERERLGLERDLLLERLDASYDLIAVHVVEDGRRRRVWNSRSHLTVLGHAPEDLLGDDVTNTALYDAEWLRDSYPTQIASIVNGSLPQDYKVDVPLRHADGHLVWFEARVSLDAVDPSHVTTVFRDITDRLERHRLELQMARFDVERRKDEEAMAFFSHELKTRFITCRYLADSVRQTIADVAPYVLEVPHNASECLDDLVGQLQRGVRICMDAALAKQLMHGVYTPRARSVELREELHVFCGRRLTLGVEVDVPHVVELDFDLVLHALENFASNASKYGVDGAVPHLTVHATSERRGDRQLLFAVTNQCTPNPGPLRTCGHDEDLFAAGTRGEAVSGASNGNGLYFVRKCAQALQGQGRLVFQPRSVRAELEVALVVDGPTPSDGAAEDVVDLATPLDSRSLLPPNTRVASVDNSHFTRLVDAACFAELGVEAFVRGETASEIAGFPEFVASMDPPPQAVIVDYRLDDPSTGHPMLLGTDLIPRIRELGYTGVVLVKSANDTSADIQKFESMGADGAIAKGISVRALGGAIARAMRASARPALSTVADAQLSTLDTSVLEASSRELRWIAVRGFEEESPLTLQAARDAFGRGDASATWAHVHRMKGQAAYVGATRLGELCESMRDLALNEMDGRLAAVAEEVDVVLDALRVLESSPCSSSHTHSDASKSSTRSGSSPRRAAAWAPTTRGELAAGVEQARLDVPSFVCSEKLVRACGGATTLGRMDGLSKQWI